MATNPNLTQKSIYTQRISVTRFSPAMQYVDIYVNSTTGSDTANGASPATAFLTIPKAIETNVFTISTGTVVRINLAGADEHLIPEGYVFPDISSPDGITEDSTQPYGFTLQAPLVIRAVPTSLQAIASSDIDAQTLDEMTELVTLETNLTFTVNEFQGKFLVDALGTVCSVASNTASDIVVANAGTLTAPINVYEYGAIINNASSDSLQPTISIRSGNGPVLFQGCDLRGNFAEVAGNALSIMNGVQVGLIGCAVQGFSLGYQLSTLSLSVLSDANLSLLGSAVTGEVYLVAGPFQATNSTFTGVTFPSITTQSFATFSSSIFDGCDPVCYSSATSALSSVVYTDVLVINATSIGIRQSAGIVSFSGVRVNDSADVGIQIENMAFARMEFFAGDGNVGGGLFVYSGAQVSTDGTSDINVAQASPLVVGNNGSVTWSAYHTAGEEVDATSNLCRAFDVG